MMAGERRRLLHLRRLVDEAPPIQRETLAWMARMLGPDRLGGVDEAIGKMKAGVPLVPPGQQPRFEEVLGRLPLKYREVLRLREQGLTQREIGVFMGFSSGWAGGMERRAYAVLGHKLRFCEPVTQEVFGKHRWLFTRLGFCSFEALPLTPTQPQPHGPAGIPHLVDLDMPVAALGLSVRAQNCLQNLGVLRLGELIALDEAQLLRTRQLGRKTLKEIKEALGELGLSLAMRAPYSSHKAVII